MVIWMFSVLAAGAVTRVIIPLLDPGHYTLLMGLSQVLWILAFVMFLLTFLPMLFRMRTDGQFG